VPKAVYRRGFYDKQTVYWWNSVPGSHTPQSGMLSPGHSVTYRGNDHLVWGLYDHSYSTYGRASKVGGDTSCQAVLLRFAPPSLSTSFFSFPHFSSFSYHFLLFFSLAKQFQIQPRSLRERCRLPQRDPGGTPAIKALLYILSPENVPGGNDFDYFCRF